MNRFRWPSPLFWNLLMLVLVSMITGLLIGRAHAQDSAPAPADPADLLEALQRINSVPQFVTETPPSLRPLLHKLLIGHIRPCRPG